MSEAPDLLPDPRARGRKPARDEVIDILRALRLTGGVFLEAEFTAPWCVRAQLGPEDCSPFLPQPRSIIAYHYVSAGRLLLGVAGVPPIAVEAGELVVLPRKLGSASCRERGCESV